MIVVHFEDPILKERKCNVKQRTEKSQRVGQPENVKENRAMDIVGTF